MLFHSYGKLAKETIKRSFATNDFVKGHSAAGNKHKSIRLLIQLVLAFAVLDENTV